MTFEWASSLSSPARPVRQSPRTAQRITKKGFFLFSGLENYLLYIHTYTLSLFLCHFLSFDGSVM